MKRTLITLILIFLLVSACAGAGGTVPPADTPTLPPTEAPTSPPVEPTPMPTHIPVDIPPAVRAAIDALTQSQGVSAGQVTVVSVEAVTWPDGCLGVVRPGVMCTQQTVPGFRIILEASGKQYEYHTNQDGSNIAPSEGGPLEMVTPAEQAAIQALSRSLGIPAGEVQVVSSAIVEWPDSCLGVALPGIVCAQMITPGYLIVLEANGVQYEYHTNDSGSAARPGSIALTWQRQGGIAGFCDNLTVFLSGETHAGRCNASGQMADGSLRMLVSKQDYTQLQQWLADYGSQSFTLQDSPGADALIVEVLLNGSGGAAPDDASQQAIASWAQALFSQMLP
jgi:hypothetical protein